MEMPLLVRVKLGPFAGGAMAVVSPGGGRASARRVSRASQVLPSGGLARPLTDTAN